MDFITQPASRAAGSAECFTRAFQEAFMAPGFAAAQVDAVTIIIGTVWVRHINDFTGPMVVIFQKSSSMQQMQTWFTSWTARSIEFVFFVTLVTCLHAASRVRAVFTSYAAHTCP